MVSRLDNTNRYVIPVWRDFKRTVELGELTLPVKARNVSAISVDYSNLERQWRDNPSLHHSTDLFSALLSNNKLDIALANEVSQYILDHPKANIFQKEFIQKSLEKKEQKTGSEFLEYEKIKEFVSLFEDHEIYKKIHNLKKKTFDFPRDAILYIELARYYTIISQFKKAEKFINIALKLNQANRYVLRSAARFFVLINELDKARFYLRRSRLASIDPWLMASEISISELIGKTSNNIKKGVALSESKNYRDFDLTELRSSLATFHLFSGKTKDSKKLFKKSLHEPNDNSMAQIEWASNKYNLFFVNPEEYKVNNNFEALFYDAYEEKEWKKAFQNSLLWYLDTPYNLEPVFRGANIAGFFLDDFEKAENFTKYGLYNDADNPILINNLAYFQARNSKIEEARQTINRIDTINEDNIKIATRICLDATSGLIEIKDNNLDVGIQLYKRAILASKLFKNEYLEILGELELGLSLPKGHMQREEIKNKYAPLEGKLGQEDLNTLASKLIRKG